MISQFITNKSKNSEKSSKIINIKNLVGLKSYGLKFSQHVENWNRNHRENFSTPEVSQTLLGNPKGSVELGNPNTCAETKLCLNFILFRLKK